jgi:alanine racemase
MRADPSPARWKGSSLNTVTARIHLDSIAHNLATVRRICRRSRIMAVVKADAYGHGLVPVARALNDADGFAVARLAEAVALRQAGIQQRILVLSTLFSEDCLAACGALDLDITVHDGSSLNGVCARANIRPLNIWLKLDSGMHRAGFKPADFLAADQRLRGHSAVREIVHMTHFSAADDPQSAAFTQQFRTFSQCHAHRPHTPVSLANSAALLRYPETRGDWVRPGILLYGGTAHARQRVQVRPAMTLTARVIALRELPAGASVGYHGRWIGRARARIATIGVGYGDGYPISAPDGAPVMINGRMARVAGRVSMDSLCVDVSHCGPVAVGDAAELWGASLPIGRVARAIGTIDYALLSSLTSRVDRIYDD